MNLHTMKLDIFQIFPTLNLFSPGHPYHEKLHDILSAFISYRPDIGYVPGMSSIAGMALIVFDNTYDAFVTFANILNRSYHQAFYSMNEEKFLLYFNDFDKLFARCLPRLYKHFKLVGFETTMFLFDWFFTLFSRILPLETCIRIWDLYFLYEESALFYAALAILKLCEKDLLTCNFDDLSSLLCYNTTLLQSLTPDILIISMYSFHHLKRFNTSNLHKTHQVASRESLFAMHQLPLSISKDDVTQSNIIFPSIYSIPRCSSRRIIPKSGPIDHSARSPRSISDESDGALDIDDQYLKAVSETNSHAQFSALPFNKSSQIVAHSMKGDDGKGVRKVNKSTRMATCCTNPCVFHHAHLQSVEKKSGTTTSQKKLPQFYSSYSLDHSTTYRLPTLRQNIRISNIIGRTSAEMIP
ncbi:unnamed protein product [Schistosoma turkestanicum]|nr:unnamed protein product [Schistosoma turkestanicum]